MPAANLPKVLVQLADASARARAAKALAGRFAVTEADPADAPASPRAAAEALAAGGYRAAVLDYREEDAASVKLLQAVTDREAAGGPGDKACPRLLFVLPPGAEPDYPQWLMAMNEGAWAILPSGEGGVDPAALANYADRAVHGPGRFRRETRTEAPEALAAPELEEQVRQGRAQTAAAQRLISKLLSTPSAEWPRRVLVASDSAFQRDMLERLLTEHGYEVMTAATSSEALQLALTRKPRIVVSDYEMEEMNGVDFCRSLKIEHKFVPCHFVVCTANKDKADRILVPGNGVDDCLAKPSGPGDHLDFIARVSMGLLL